MKEEIISLRKQGLSYQKIGDIVSLSKQRVNKIYSDGKRSNKIILVFIKCKFCGKEMIISKIIEKRAKYCSISCKADDKRIYTKEEKKRVKNVRNKKNYHSILKHDPKFVEKIRKRNKKNYLKRKKK